MENATDPHLISSNSHVLYTTDHANNCTEGLDWSWMHTAKLFLFSPIVFFAIFGNLLALFAFLTRYSQMKSPTHFFIANLALADFLVGVLCLPFLAVQSVTGVWYFGESFCFAYVMMHLWFCSCSIYSTCAICVERYIGVRYPLNHKKIMSTFRVLCIILLIWIYGGIITCASIFFWPNVDEGVRTSTPTPEYHFEIGCESTSVGVKTYPCNSNKKLGHAIFSTLFIVYIPVVIMVILYTRIYMIATKHLKVLRNCGSKIIKTRRGLVRISGMDQDSGASNNTVVTIDSVSLDCDNSSIIRDLKDNGKTSYGDVKKIPKPNNKWFPSMKRIQLPLTLHEPSSNHDSTERLVKATNSKRHIYLAKKLVFLVGILLASYVPYYTVFLIRTANQNWASVQLFTVLKWFRYLNSAINPFLYAFAVPAYRKAFANIIVRRKFFK